MYGYRRAEIIRQRKERREKKKNFQKIVNSIYKKLLKEGVDNPYEKAKVMARERDQKLSDLLNQVFNDAFKKAWQD